MPLVRLIHIVGCPVFKNELQGDVEFTVVDWALQFGGQRADRKKDRSRVTAEVRAAGGDKPLKTIVGLTSETELTKTLNSILGV